MSSSDSSFLDSVVYAKEEDEILKEPEVPTGGTVDRHSYIYPSTVESFF